MQKVPTSPAVRRQVSTGGAIELQLLPEQTNDDGLELNPFLPEDEDSSDGSSKRNLRFADDGHGGPPPGSATPAQVVVNIVISFVGAGLLGVPNAFMKSGWLLGFVALLVVSALNVYAMLRLPAVQTTLQTRYPNESLHSYGDVGRCVFGRKGEILVQVCIAISQAGFGTAYIIFISANISSIANYSRLSICLACIPGLVVLVQFRDLKSLAPFSL
jgi:proton-coupled amino acid transporter